MMPRSMSRWFALLGLPLLQLVPSIGAASSQVVASATSSDASGEYWYLNPAEALEQLPQTLRELREASRDLFEPNRRASLPTPEPVGSAIDRYLRVLFMVMAYGKAGIYGADPQAKETWESMAEEFEDPLEKHDSFRFFSDAQQKVIDTAETDAPCHPRKLVQSAAGASAEIQFDPFTNEPHQLLAEKTAPLLSAMSFLAAKAFRISHKIRGLVACVEESIFYRPGFSYLTSNPEAIENDLEDIKMNLLEFRDRLSGYLVIRGQAELDLNTQSILDAIEPTFTSLGLAANIAFCGRFSRQLTEHNRKLVPLLEQILGMDPFFLVSLRTPLRESLAALQDPQYREGIVHLLTLIKETGALLPGGVSEADFGVVPLDERLVSWLNGRESVITEIAGKMDSRLAVGFAYGQLPLCDAYSTFSRILTHGVTDFPMEEVMQVVDQALAKAELVPVLARKLIVPVALGHWVDMLELGGHLCGHLRHTAQVLSKLQHYIWRGGEHKYESTGNPRLRSRGEIMADLRGQWRQPEIIARLEAVRTRFEEIVAEFEALPLLYLRTDFGSLRTEIEPLPSFSGQ